MSLSVYARRLFASVFICLTYARISFSSPSYPSSSNSNSFSSSFSSSSFPFSPSSFYPFSSSYASFPFSSLSSHHSFSSLFFYPHSYPNRLSDANIRNDNTRQDDGRLWIDRTMEMGPNNRKGIDYGLNGEEEGGERLSRYEAKRIKRGSSGLIFPGTTWCGAGNTSESFNEANGHYSGTDLCCRQHDLCPHYITKFSKKYGLFNARIHTISHCECDDEFRSCLRMERRSHADEIGKMYFNYLGVKCFVLEKQIGCKRRNWLGICTEKGWVYKAHMRDQEPFNAIV